MSSIRSIAQSAVEAAIFSSGDAPATHTETRPSMGGHATITVVGGTRDLLSRAFALLDECEALWSRFIGSSDVSILNNAEGTPTVVAALTVRLIEEMKLGNILTNGDFDPTLLPALVSAGYSKSVVNRDRKCIIPASATAPGNLAGISVDGLSVTMPRGTTIDSGGVGKGLAADIVGQFIVDAGAWGALVEVSGDVVAVGLSPDRRGWCIGIENPLDPASHVDIVRLSSGAVVTSSQRKRRWTTAHGARHHLIDPRTGDSAVSDIQTVTVVAASGARAETLSKSGFLRNPDEYLAWLPTVGAAGLLIDANGACLTTENWKDYS